MIKNENSFIVTGTSLCHSRLFSGKRGLFYWLCRFRNSSMSSHHSFGCVTFRNCCHAMLSDIRMTTSAILDFQFRVNFLLPSTKWGPCYIIFKSCCWARMSNIEYSDLLFEISRKLDVSELQRLLFIMCRKDIAKGSQGSIRDVLTLFEELERNNRLGIDHLDILKQILTQIKNDHSLRKWRRLRRKEKVFK